MISRKRKQNKPPSISESDLAKLSPAARKQIEQQLGKIDQAEEKATTTKQKAVVARRRRSLLARLGTRLRLIASTKKYKVQARNLNKAPIKRIKVRARTETDALAEAKRRLGKGFDEFQVKNPTDQELIILKAATHTNRNFPTGGPASISEVLKTVSFPKHVTKKIILGLAENGVIALQFHAHPSILTREERKNLLYVPGASKGHVSDYAIGFSLRDPDRYRQVLKNPGRKHLPRATAKQQRQYEHILESEMKSGRSKKTSKRIAASTVRARAKKNTQRIVSRKLTIRKGYQVRDKFGKWHTVISINGNILKVSGGTVHKSNVVEVKKNPSKVLSTVKRVAIKAGKTAIGAVKGAIRGGVKAARNPIRHFIVSYKTPARTYYLADIFASSARAAIAKYKKDFGKKLRDYSGGKLIASLKNPARGTRKRGGVKAAKGNPAKKRILSEADKWEKLWSAYIKALKDYDKSLVSGHKHSHKAPRMRLAKAEKAIQRYDPEAYKKYILGRRNRTPKKKVSTRKRKRNSPIAEQQRKQFAGHFDGYRDLYYPSTNPPKEPSKLGELKSIRTSKADFNPIKGSMWLVRDSKGQLHIGTTRQGEMFAGPVQDFGVVERIEYLERKPHLGDPELTEYYHRMGEENGIKPHLWSDGKGGLVFRGGDYRIESRGIVN